MQKNFLDLIEPDPGKIAKVFKSTINELSLILDATKRVPWGEGNEIPKKMGAKIVTAFKAYEKVINGFTKLADDKTIPKVWRESFSREVKRMKEFRGFLEYCKSLTGKAPPLYDTKIAWFSIKRTISKQAYLLFEIIKPLVDEHNKHEKEFTDSDIHKFIAELLTAVYQDKLEVEAMTPLKIKGMIRDIRTKSSKKKLAELHRIIDNPVSDIYPEKPILAVYTLNKHS